MKHKFHNCTNDRCIICRGDLKYCEQCKGAEASLPTECPGRPLTELQESNLILNKINYINNRWIQTATETQTMKALT